MKTYFKKILQKILYFSARAILKKYQPKVIGITGSIGKSTTKEAIFAVLKDNFRVRTNIKNYNNEIGLPLTIIGKKSANRSFSGWLNIFWSALKLILVTDNSYPEILILEMGIDRVGDMAYLTSLAPADIGIVTNVGPVHLEFFKTIDRVAKEKSVLISSLKSGGWGVLNADNEKVLGMKNIVKGRFLTYGFGSDVDVRAIEINLSYKNGLIAGTSFKLSHNGVVIPIFLPNVLADHLVYSALAAACVGIILEMNLVQISESLQGFVPPLGRMHLLDGINGSHLIDDTYNASPESVLAAIGVLDKVETAGRKIAVLGDMLELGDYEREGHELIGRAVAEAKLDALVLVGERARIIGESAQEANFKKKNIFYFSDSIQAGEFLAQEVGIGDALLIKGSQGVRMEKTVKMLLEQPERAEELLVRQDEEWLK